MRSAKIIRFGDFRQTHSSRSDAHDVDRAAVSPPPKRSRVERSFPLLGSQAARTHPQAQSGVLAYRKADKGDVEVLLVRKLRSRSWGIPKGKVKRRLSAAENAAKEAFEEAGVKGHVQQRAAGSFRAVKRVHDQKIVIEVAVHLLEVTKTAKTWSEKAKRETKWCSPEEAANLLREPLLADLCVRLRDQLTP